MSRIGRLPITVPAGVTVTVDSNNLVTVKGPKGTLSQQVNHAITVNQEGNTLHLTRANDNKENRAMHGLYRALVHNMVVGVTDGFSKTLELVGTGYRAAAEGGKKLTIKDVFIVWFSKTLQNWKALVSTTVSDGMYYEITHNGDKGETYLDVYKKWDNQCIAD